MLSTSSIEPRVMRAVVAALTDANAIAGRIRYRHWSPVGMMKANQLSGPMREVRRRAHWGQLCLFGYTANAYCSMNPSTNTGSADAAAVRNVVTLSVTE